MSNPFVAKNCTLCVVATGEAAASLYDFKDIVRRIPLSSIYYHFWGSRLRSFVHPEYHNDFARWAHDSLHDNILSERLGIIDPTDYIQLEDLRLMLIEIIEQRLDEMDFIFWSKKENKFHFLRSILIIFETGIVINSPAELTLMLDRLTANSIYYHFIDARRRTPDGLDDFSTWLSHQKGYEEVVQSLRLIDPYFLSLSEIKMKLLQVFHRYFP